MEKCILGMDFILVFGLQYRHDSLGEKKTQPPFIGREPETARLKEQFLE